MTRLQSSSDNAGADKSLALRAWLIVGLLFFVGLFNYLDRLMLITMRLSIKGAIPMSDAQFGLLTTVFLFVYAGFIPFAGFVADKFGCSRLIVISLFTWSAATWLTAHANTFTELLLTRGLLGATQACYLPAAGALIGKYHRNATLSLATGIHLSGVMGGAILSGVGGWLAERNGWRYPFELFGVIGVCYSVPLLGLLRDPKTPLKGAVAEPGVAEANAARPSLGDTFRLLFRCRGFVLALVLYTLMSITSWVFLGWMPSFLGEHFRLAEGKAGLIATGTLNCGSLIGFLVGGAWADRWTRTRIPARAWVGIIGLFVALPCVVLIADATSLGMAIAGLLVFGVSRAFPDTNMIPILFQIVGPRSRATALGFLYCCGTIAGGILIYLGGAIRDAHIDIIRMFYVGMAGLVLAAALLWIIRPGTVNCPVSEDSSGARR